MSDKLKYVDFKPPWMKDLTEEDERILGQESVIGSPAEGFPRLFTRLLPLDSSSGVSAKTLSETIQMTQTIVNYAGYDVYYGFNPAFADLRSVSADVYKLSKLTIEPFEEGSFIIPAKMEAEAIQIPEEGGKRNLVPQDVIDRFNELLQSFGDKDLELRASIGAIQAIESLGRIIRREVGAIEYTVLDSRGTELKPISVNEELIQQVSRTKQRRRSTCAQMETLEGRLTAIDIVRETLQIDLSESTSRVSGKFSRLLQPSIVEGLGRVARFTGQVERKSGQPTFIQVESFEIPDDA